MGLILDFRPRVHSGSQGIQQGGPWWHTQVLASKQCVSD